MRILGIGSHPDDLEILCGGTLAKYSATGHEVIMAIITDGSAGSTDLSIEELREIRYKEALQSAKLIKAEFIWLGESDELFFETKETRYKIADLIRQSKPDVIITHSPVDYHPDHQAVSKAVLNASFVSSLPNIKTTHEVHPLVCPLFYMDTLAGLHFQPSHYVDISDFFEIKRKMLACHASQVKWLKNHDNIDIIDLIETVAKFRGYQAGVIYAEGFQNAPYWLRVKPSRLLP
ncbi:MAG: PIG-L deacetylase family protein [Candidatus Helarchaeota archaeon]